MIRDAETLICDTEMLICDTEMLIWNAEMLICDSRYPGVRTASHRSHGLEERLCLRVCSSRGCQRFVFGHQLLFIAKLR